MSFAHQSPAMPDREGAADSETGNSLSVPPIEWRNVPEDRDRLVFLLLNGALLWGACIALFAAGVVGIIRGERSGWLLASSDILVLIPILVGLTIWNWPHPEQRIVVDFERQEVVFEHLRRYTRFWPELRADHVICRFDEILAVEPRLILGKKLPLQSFLQGRGAVLTIHTSQGRFVVRFKTENSYELHEALRAVSRAEQFPVVYQQWFPTAVGVVLVLAVVVALFAFGVLP